MGPWTHRVLQISINTDLSSLPFQIHFKEQARLSSPSRLNSRLRKLFCKGPVSKYFRLCGPCGMRWNTKAAPDEQVKERRNVTAFDKTIFTKTSSRLEFAESRSHSFQWVNEMLPAFFSLWIFKMCSESIIYDRVLKRSLRWEFFQDKRSTSGA